MAAPWISIRLTAAIIVIAALVVPWAFPAVTMAVVMKIAKVIPALSLPLIVLLAVEATLLLLAAIWWLWWRLPKRQVRALDIQIHDPKARADTEDNFRKTVGQALGGAAVLIGAGAAYLQFTQQQQAARDLLISNQVAKGFEQLAGKETAMRLGGIYALEGVMNTSSAYHQPVLEALCAFVREGTVSVIIGNHPTADIQAALTVIGRRAGGLGQVYLANINIPGADLRGANLKEADLQGSNLSGVDMSAAKLIGADLRRADLSRANLTDSNLNHADLRYAKLMGAFLAGSGLGHARLSNANLSYAQLIDTNLENAVLINAELTGAVLFDANLSGANLSYATLNGDSLSSKDRDLLQEQLDAACGHSAKLPLGLRLQKRCAGIIHADEAIYLKGLNKASHAPESAE